MRERTLCLSMASLSIGFATLSFWVTTLLAAGFSPQALAAVSPEEAARLGQDLTPLGATRAGNAEGSIPAWTGGLSADYEGPRFADPFADESPLFTITAANMDQYQAQLTAGQQALLRKYPDTFRMPVYPSHRTAAFPQHVYDLAKKNALNAHLVDGGNGIADFEETLPFPIPENGLEVIWNHITRYRGGSVERTLIQAPVYADGDFTPVRFYERLVWPQYLREGFDPEKDANILSYFTQKVEAPARMTGNVLLIHETLNQVRQPRRAWVYNAGQRRVRRAPQVAYDAPGTAAEGLRTSDNLDMYNGAPDKYNWKLLGKKEIFIPYNSFKLASRDLSYDEIIQPGHLNPELLRYERHRVWVVEASLKEGERHVYAKRRFYVDEDTWQIAVAEHYDGRGELWRVAEAYEIQFRRAQVPWIAAEALHDLQSGRYLVGSLTNEEDQGFVFGTEFSRRDFTTSAIRRSGMR